MSTNLSDDKRASMLSEVPPNADVTVARILLERATTEEEARKHLDWLLPTFPPPEGAPVPVWATDVGEWKFWSAGDGWQRSVSRSTEVDGRVLAFSAVQAITEAGGDVCTEEPSLNPDGIDGYILSPGQIREVAGWLDDCAGAFDASRQSQPA